MLSDISLQNEQDSVHNSSKMSGPVYARSWYLCLQMSSQGPKKFVVSHSSACSASGTYFAARVVQLGLHHLMVMGKSTPTALLTVHTMADNGSSIVSGDGELDLLAQTASSLGGSGRAWFG